MTATSKKDDSESARVNIPSWAMKAGVGAFLTSSVGFAAWMTSVASDVRVIREVVVGVVQTQSARDMAQDVKISLVHDEVKDVKGRVVSVESDMKNKVDKK